ncbi:hypothetical protein I5M32_15145 [Pedobacter sp. SD-b]|uniref:Uncharacterized protein n=1 Tax=Pedobacter segetis TaxID=2793069 RepID=A0ABS1BN26_9SPHI|nr:hypothetical protein [Pedobacter segetis]MBK0384302.1 hypothetical protein [Pedobacter segetis]
MELYRFGRFNTPPAGGCIFFFAISLMDYCKKSLPELQAGIPLLSLTQLIGLKVLFSKKLSTSIIFPKFAGSIAEL